MAAVAWGQSIARIGAAGTQYNTFTTAKSMLTSATSTAASEGLVTLPPGFWIVGGMLHIYGSCSVSTVVTTPATFTYQTMLGTVATPIIAFTSGAMNTTITSNVNIPVDFDIKLKCLSIGNGTLATLAGSSTWWGVPMAMASGLTNGLANTGWAKGPNTAMAAGTGFDSTIANVLDFFIAESLSGATTGFRLDAMNVVSYGNHPIGRT
jgi:hypothetical protein